MAGKYRVSRLIGSGGMGSVYEAENVTLGKKVALKFLHMSAQQDETSAARFHREARAISAVQSTHIVQIFDWGQDEDTDGTAHPFLVMELLAGGDLAQRIDRLGRLSLGEALRLTVETLRGLRRVHRAGIVHRDLKPENLFLVTGDDEQLHVKIVDFGLSKLTEETVLDGNDFAQTAKLTQAGTVVGTPLYMSPEQVEGVIEVDLRCDLWAMGAILHEMLAGEPPFMDRSYARLVMAICGRDPEDLTRLNPEVTPEVAGVVRRALTKDRERRFQTADAFLEALTEAAPEDVSASGPRAPAAGSVAIGSTVPASGPTSSAAYFAEATASDATLAAPPPMRRVPSAESLPSSVASADDGAGPLDATIAAHTGAGGATLWLTEAPLFSIWRGEVDAPDRLRVEARDGSVRDLRLEPRGPLTLGRVERVGDQLNDLVYADVASRLAARLDHDGVRWWLERRQECSVPVQVGTRSLDKGQRAPLVHGTFVTVGAMRATLVDRRYVSRSVPADAVDPGTGLLARGGLEQEVATALQRKEAHALVLVLLGPDPPGQDSPPSVRAALAIHRLWPSMVVARDRETVALVVRGEERLWQEHAARAAAEARAAGAAVLAAGAWRLEGDPANAGSELERAFNAVDAAAGPGVEDARADVTLLRDAHPGVQLAAPERVIERARSPKQQALLFGIEDQAALARIGPRVVSALEHELAAMIQTMIGPSATVTRMAPGVVAVSVSRRFDATQLGIDVQCEWHARPTITDGKVELPRMVSFEEALVERLRARADELSAECAEPQGVLSALSGGLPHPIAGRVHAAIGAASAVERVKMLFDVLEGTWRFIAVTLGAAYFAGTPTAGEGAPSEPMRQAWASFFGRVKTRSGLPLGSWRELARLSMKGLSERKGFAGERDPVGRLGTQLLEVELAPNQTFDTLSNLLHTERNNFAHGHYSEARAAADVQEFEQMTRTFLRALRPLAAWTLVSVHRTEPDLYGESQTVDFIDHTGPYASGARRRIGFHSPLRLANVVYLARWRDGLVLPLEPWVRRLVIGERHDLAWLDHLPRPGRCRTSTVVSGVGAETEVDARRLPPLLQQLVGGA